jgi:hypothetical protein
VIKWQVRNILPILFLLLLQGCATYGAGLGAVLEDVKQGNFAASEAQLKQALSPGGSDRLLYYLELGVIRHLNADYRGSNQAFEQAERISEQLETTSLVNSTLAMFSNARQADYAGQPHEKLLINYFKALNYLALAAGQEGRNERLDALDGARVEARRLILKLNDMRDQQGSYAEQAEQDSGTLALLNDVFSALSGSVINEDNLTYRDDALAHYLTGLSFEMNREYDDARISYQRAAETYEQGYAKQYRLGNGMAQQAWLDSARMMALAGGYDSELARLKQDKLTSAQRQQLEQFDPQQAQVVVIEHKGLAPELEELNVNMWADPYTRSLKLQPYLLANDSDAWAWFYLLYSDKGVYNILTAYLDGTQYGFSFSPFTKTILLGPAWQQLESLGLDKAIGSSLRVTVPYYRRITPLGGSTLTVNTSGQEQSLVMDKAASPAQLALQQRLLHSSADIQQALARSALKAVSAQAVGDSVDSQGLVSFIGKMAAQLTEAAETRSWLLLPNDIRIRRVMLPAGDNELTLTSTLEPGVVDRHQTRMTLQAGEIALWQVRSLGNISTSK